MEWCLQMDPTQGFAQKVIPQSLLILHGWAQVINLFGVPSSVRLLVSFCWLLLHLCCGQISRFSWVLMTQNHAKKLSPPAGGRRGPFWLSSWSSCFVRCCGSRWVYCIKHWQSRGSWALNFLNTKGDGYPLVYKQQNKYCSTYM